jgi:6-phosphogluconolactonase
VNWARVHLFWGDERWVPAIDPRSNLRMAREALIDHVHCPPEHVHPVPVDASSPDMAAREYARTLHTFFRAADAGPDLVLLGMGSDGHTASLFPHSPALDEQRRWAVASLAPVEPRERVTLTIPLINRAMHVFMLVAGHDKQAAFDAATSGHADPHRCPVALVRPCERHAHLVGNGDAIIATGMQIGMIGLGRMGGNMVRRLLAAGHQCVVYDRQPAAATRAD